MKGTPWVIIDTETDGLYEPIHIVEIAGQLMDDWNPVGEPFRMLLNHDVPIDPAAIAIHGYTREYLREHGQEPLQVHEAFRQYAKDYPLVAHNLSFDWNRCFEPEWARLSIPRIGQRGFCCMMLARRLVPEVQSYRLDVLKEHFQLTNTRSHRAQNDVLTVVELFQKIYRPRLASAKLDTFNEVSAFAKRTPVAKCLDLIRSAFTIATKTPALKDEWYFIDATNNARGPLPAWQISQNVGLEAYYVWREGMADWAVNRDCVEFIVLCQPPSIASPPAKKIDSTKTMPELLGVCRGILADDKITTAEVMFLNSWLQDAGFISEWPASEIAHLMEKVLEDHVVTKDEKAELKKLLQRITNGSEAAHQVSQTAATVTVVPTKSLPYSIIQVEQGTREWIEWRHKGIGASDAPVIMGENPWKNVSEMLQHKCGAAKAGEENEAMARGTMLEPEARKKYILKRGIDVQPACLQSKQYEWLRASVDGLSADGNVIVEIKCGNSTYRSTAMSGKVPSHYYGQLQHILAVTGLASLDFWCYSPGRPELLVTVNRDDGYIARLLKAEESFWQKATKKI